MLFLAPTMARNVTLVDRKARSIQLAWIAPEYENGIVFYKIKRDQDTLEEGFTAMSYTFKDLLPYVSYNFSIQAFTRNGGYAPTATISIRTDSESECFCCTFSSFF
jgi:hypothetical protein